MLRQTAEQIGVSSGDSLVIRIGRIKKLVYVIGLIRSIGVTRREVFGLILNEALLLGIVGTALGIVVGIFLGKGMVRLWSPNPLMISILCYPSARSKLPQRVR